VARLNIPERFRAGLSKIRELDERSVQLIRDALEQPVPGFSSDEDGKLPKRPSDIPIEALSSVPNDTEKADLRQIADAIAGLYAAKAERDVGVEEFADRVCDAMEALDSKELRLPHAEREQFRKKILTLLNADVFAIVSKARIEEGPKGMVVVHHLKVDYHQGSPSHHQFYVTLDADDLQELRRTIDRAEAKARALRPAVRDVRLFGVPKERK
jgi:hypothetical protein